MSKEYEKVLQVISKPPESRYDHEVHQLVPWFRSKAKLFKSLKSDLLADIIRNCDYLTKNRDDVVIKQGDIGDCFYIVLSGKVTIYILNKDQSEGEEDDGNFDHLIQYHKDGTLDRVKLGYCVTSLESGAPFGDVALTSGDSIRTASIIADERTDLLVVDRALYNRSVKEVLAKEFQEKTTFIKNNPLFSAWPPKYRKQLAMALYNESFPYESALVKQGDKTVDMYFILSGQVEIQVDASLHPLQYPHIWRAALDNEVDRLTKKTDKYHQLSPGTSSNTPNTSSDAKRRGSMKCIRLCHLGVNESVGDVELTMDLPTYMQTAICQETTVVLVLENRHYERLFTRRHQRTIESMRDQIGVRLVTRMALLNTQSEIPFLRFVKKLIDSRHKPQIQSDKDKEELTLWEAEKEFLNHKGPLIDQDGPGSVFYLIRLREKTKRRVKAKRGDRKDRPAHVSSQSVPKAVPVPSDVPLHTGHDLTTITSSPAASQDLGKSSKKTRNTFSHIYAKFEGNKVHSIYDGSNNSEGPSHISRLMDELANAEKHDAKLRVLEDRLRNWLEVDNPRGKPQVAKLRRLTFQEMGGHPKPGNRVVIKRKKNGRLPEAIFSSTSFSSSSNDDTEARLEPYKILLSR